ncbi:MULTISPECIES: MoaD/ThiS family protein [unclassified Rothia (in: high G+C Gram-positive bacteria)]|uniref:MoaD/ThiS family protein n=1 Tax=unclassified Rothia (in: high G+C Gram-positive bacteria) TaxID=2689056 RepID=UPI00195D54E2|nr:MoaD/ThiS family protein [Rothia sp. ZJ932]MBM7051864.1 MoaD/ThiS family protein [Rothia sp. ZJ1223]QRZ62055.1 MoaD/ThiS family protein [Rothia sp. ZJ932]
MNVHFFAAARAAAGTSSAEVSLEDLKEPTLAALLNYLPTRFTGTTAAGMSLGQVLAQCSFLIDGESSPATASLAGATRVDVLPPFAGG